MSSKFNFDASIYFMNNTLPEQWHDVFIASQIIKIMNEKRYSDLVSFRNKLNDNYNKPFRLLGLKNNLIITSAKSKVVFQMMAFGFRIVNNIKSQVRLFLK